MPSLAGIKTLAGEQSGDNIITQAAQADRKWGDWPGWLAMVVTRHLMYRVIIRCGAAWPPVLIITRDIGAGVTMSPPCHLVTLTHLPTFTHTLLKSQLHVFFVWSKVVFVTQFLLILPHHCKNMKHAHHLFMARVYRCRAIWDRGGSLIVCNQLRV